MKKTDRNFLRCSRCSLIFLYPRPRKSDINKIYNSNYFKTRNEDDVGYEDYLKLEPFLRPYFEKKVKQINEIVGEKRGKFLDVGCALGILLEIAQKHKYETFGLDVSSFAVEKVKEKGIKAEVGELVKAKFKSNYFDVIVTLQLMEHLLDPLEFLLAAKKFLRKGGVLLLTTPDIEGILPKLLGKKWYGWDMPDHICYFNKDALNSALEKAGFKKVVIKTDDFIIVSLEEVGRRTKIRYPNMVTEALYKVIEKLPNILKNKIFIPQIGTHGLLAVAKK